MPPETAAPVTAPAMPTIAVPAAKAPPPIAAREAFVRAVPDNVLIAVPVVAVAPRRPAPPAAAAIGPAAARLCPLIT